MSEWVTTPDTNEQTWNIHACCILIRACGILLAFPHFQGFHTLFHQEEQRSLPTGLPEMDRNPHSVGQNARSRVSAIEWESARASRCYCFKKIWNWWRRIVSKSLWFCGKLSSTVQECVSAKSTSEKLLSSTFPQMGRAHRRGCWFASANTGWLHHSARSK